jgi:hypothetical protein
MKLAPPWIAAASTWRSLALGKASWSTIGSIRRPARRRCFRPSGSTCAAIAPPSGRADRAARPSSIPHERALTIAAETDGAWASRGPWPPPRPGNTKGFPTIRGCFSIASRAIFGSLSVPAVPFSRASAGMVHSPSLRCSQRIAATLPARWAVNSKTLTRAPKPDSGLKDGVSNARSRRAQRTRRKSCRLPGSGKAAGHLPIIVQRRPPLEAFRCARPAFINGRLLVRAVRRGLSLPGKDRRCTTVYRALAGLIE